MPRIIICQFGLILLTMYGSLPTSFSQEKRAAESETSEREVAEAKLLAKLQMTSNSERGELGVAKVNVVPLVGQPLLLFEDPTRANTHGALRIWATGGRPTALLETYQVENNLWVMLVNQLDAGSYRVTLDRKAWWSPQKSDLEWQELPVLDPPSENANQRSLQLRSIARRFAAHEFWDPNNSRFELRLHARPIHRYSDESRNILDGAIFVFSNGTNPEIAMLLEAQKTGLERKWTVGFARIGHAEMHVLMDGQTVWSVPRVNPERPTDNYWLTFARLED